MNDKAPQATNLKDAQTLIEQLWEMNHVQAKTIDVLTQQVSWLTVEVKSLKENLSKNSNNSSKPPSSDAKPAPKSLRKKSEKKSGG